MLLYKQRLVNPLLSEDAPSTEDCCRSYQTDVRNTLVPQAKAYFNQCLAAHFVPGFPDRFTPMQFFLRSAPKKYAIGVYLGSNGRRVFFDCRASCAHECDTSMVSWRPLTQLQTDSFIRRVDARWFDRLSGVYLDRFGSPNTPLVEEMIKS